MTIEAITLETGAHVVHVHQDDADFVVTVGGYVAAAIRAGDATIVIASGEHRAVLAAHLEASEINVADAREAETFATLDAADLLARFYADGQIDAGQFRSVVGGIIGRVARRTGRPVRCHGEMVALLWDAGAITAAIELEDLWNDLGRELGFSLLCTYPSQSFADSEHSDARRAVRQRHTDVVDSRREIRHFRARQTPEALAALSRLNLAPEVHQASGMVSAQLGVDTAQALNRLRSFATDHDKSLAEVAAGVVSRQMRFGNAEAR